MRLFPYAVREIILGNGVEVFSIIAFVHISELQCEWQHSGTPDINVGINKILPGGIISAVSLSTELIGWLHCCRISNAVDVIVITRATLTR